MVDRKQAIRDYKETAHPAGVFRVRNRPGGKSLLGASSNLPAMLNRQLAQLKLRSHGCRELQQDFDAQGAEAFVFEILDEIEPREGSREEALEELRLLEDLWRDRLTTAGEELYPCRAAIR